MRQRNDTGHPLTAHTDPPQVIEPGQTIEYPVLVVGLTVLDDEPTPPSVADPEPVEVPADPPPARPANRARRTDNAQEG